MRIPFPDIFTRRPDVERVSQVSREKILTWVALIAIVSLAAALRFNNLSALGDANHYYTAAISSMLKSWHNFFFLAAEPGGSVSVDKPPVGLWLQAISAYFLGVNGFAVLLPEIIAGLLSIVVVFHLVRRSFGTIAGLLSALVLAITPVTVATDRNNTIDSILILTLLLASWAFIKATENRKLSSLLLGAALVGIGFNIKMLEAFLPLPAFYSLYLLGSNEKLWHKLGKLALASLLLLVISLSWTTAVDLTPADQRPYVGSSGDNSELSLIIGYNGMDRLLGMFGRNRGNSFSGRSSGFPNRSFPGAAPGQNGGFPRGGFGARGAPPQSRSAGGFNQTNLQTAGATGVSETGQAGPLRLFIPPLSKEASWLLPLALTGLLLLVLGTRLTWPVADKHRTAILWGGWLIAAGIFFSVANFFHEYYLSTIAPPIAALVGISLAELWQIAQKRFWLASLVLIATAAITLRMQSQTVITFIQNMAWQPVVVTLFVFGLVGTLAFFIFKKRWVMVSAWFCLLAALLVTPGIWSYLTMRYPSENQSLPAAYTGDQKGPPNQGGLQINQALLDYLQANTQNTEYLMAVPSSMQGSDYVLATGRPVLYLGGFMGVDQVKTPDQLAEMVSQGELRYIYWDGRGSGFGGVRSNNGDQSSISNWVASTCKVVPGFETETRNMGAPDGTSGGQGNGTMQAFGGMQVSLYDCGG